MREGLSSARNARVSLVSVGLTLALLLTPLVGFGDHDHGAIEATASSCVASHSSGPEEGHTDAPHLRSGVDHEHDCDACQHLRVRASAPAGTRAADIPAVRSGWMGSGAESLRWAAGWQWRARGPPQGDLDRLS